MGGVVLCCLPGAWVGAMSRRVWVRGRIRLVRSDPQVAAGFQGGHGAWGPAGVGFVVQPLQHFGVVQFEGGSFGADPGQRLEVVPGWWAAGGPFQGVAVPPGVVGGGDFAVPQGPDDVPQERQQGGAEQERADGGDGVVEGESVGGQVVGVAAGHADDAEPVLDQEGDVESDEGGPEVQLAESFVEEPAGHFREPEIDPGEGGEHDGAEQDVVEVGDHEVGVGDVKVQGGGGEDDPGEAAEQERDQEPAGPQHGCFEGELPFPHGADPVEEFQPGGNGDEEGHEGEEGQQDGPGGEHVVRPHRGGQGGDAECGEYKAAVAEDGFAGENGEDLGDDAEERQRDDVDLGVPEEPEQVLPEDRPAVGRVEHVGPEVPVRFQAQQRGGEDRERDQDEDPGGQDFPGEHG